MSSGVYQIVNKCNGKMYVGSSSNMPRRFKEHIYMLKNNRHDNEHLQRAWNKYGELNFDFIVIEHVSVYKLLQREQYWIDYYAACCNGYNIAENAGSMVGFKHSDDTKEIIRQTSIYRNKTLFTDARRRKISMSKLGHVVSSETRDKIRNSNIGKCNLTDEGREKLRRLHTGNKYMLGKHHTVETKQLISQYSKGQNNGNSMLNDEQVIAIKRALLNYRKGMINELAILFHVDRTTISAIKNNKTWKHIKIEEEL